MLTPAAKLKLIHLQLTRRCNLSCPYCPQRKSRIPVPELETSEWLRICEEIAVINPLPELIIWGGEPLLSAAFPDTTRKLKEKKIKTALVSNGLLLKPFAGLINENIDTLYVSVDGISSTHDEIRGHPGLFNDIKEGMKEIAGTVKKVCLCTVCRRNCGEIPEFPFAAKELGFNKIIMQNLIYCNGRQAGKYKEWLKASFMQSTLEIDNWVIDGFDEWVETAAASLRRTNTFALSGKYPVETIIHPSEFADDFRDWFTPERKLKEHSCVMPFEHIGIMPDGRVHFCVDFCDFSLGNIRENSLEKLFNSPIAEKFRNDTSCGKNPVCARCPWLYNRQLKID